MAVDRTAAGLHRTYEEFSRQARRWKVSASLMENGHENGSRHPNGHGSVSRGYDTSSVNRAVLPSSPVSALTGVRSYDVYQFRFDSMDALAEQVRKLGGNGTVHVEFRDGRPYGNAELHRKRRSAVP